MQYHDGFTSVANLEAHPNNLEKFRETTNRSQREMKDWYGANSILELRTTCELHGWTEGLARGQHILGDIKAPKLPSYKRKRCKGMTGHSLNITAIYNGNFNKAWSTAKKIPTSDRTKKAGKVNIAISIDASCGKSAETFFWRGAVGCMLAKALQTSGRNVAMYTVANQRDLFVNGEFKYSLLLTKIKDYGYPLEMERLFSMTAYAGFYRYYMFKAMCAFEYKVDGGLGYPNHVSSELIQEAVQDDAPTIIVADIWNENQAKSAINTLLEQFN